MHSPTKMNTSKSSSDLNEKLAVVAAKTVSFDDLNAANTSQQKKAKKNAKSVKLKSAENIDQLSTTNKSVNQSKSTSLASVASSTFKFGYSYVVLLASFMSYMLASLLSSCFGVFFESMSSDLQLSRSRVAFVGSLLTALQDLAGPISSALTNHFGCRKTTIFGGLICALGVIGSAYASDFWLLGFLMGGVSGFGASLVLVSSVVVVTYYFEDKPSFAAGFTISGASFGQSIFTMIIIKLNEEYGRSGCFLILGGILLNIIVCGALFRPLKWELEDEEDDEDDEDEEDEDDEETDEEEDDDDEEETEESEEAADSPKMKKSTTKESNLSEIALNVSEPVAAAAAPMASQENLIDNLNANDCLNLYFDNQTDNIYITVENNKNENQVFYLENETRRAGLDENDHASSNINNNKSSQYLLRSRKDFSSDPCLNNNNNNLAKEENVLEMRSIGVSLISLNSNFLQENEFKQVETFQKNLFFDKHHSLQLVSSESMSSMRKREQLRAKSDLILKNYSAYSLTSKKEVLEIIDDQQDLNNAEFVLLDAEEINDNLMLSASQTAIYLPFNNEANQNDAANKKETHEEETELVMKDEEAQLGNLDKNEDDIRSASNHTDNNNNCNNNSNTTSRMMSQRNSTNALSSLDLKPNQSSANLAQSNHLKENNPNSSNNHGSTKAERPLSTFSNFLSLVSNLFSVNKSKSPAVNPAQLTATLTSPGTVTSTSSGIENKTKAGATSSKQNGLFQAEANLPAKIPNTNPVMSTSVNSANLNNQNLNKNLIRLETLILNHQQMGAKQGPKFIIARCNCRQRNLQNLQRRANKQRRAKLRSLSVNMDSTNEANLSSEAKSQSSLIDKQQNKPTTQIQQQQQQFKFRHFPNCPINNLKRIRQLHLINNLNLSQPGNNNNQHHNSTNHHHHHHHLQSVRQRNNLYYVPSLFQNSYRFPLHFKNVYYYKSLINLNMRLRNLKSHSNHPATLAGVFDTSFQPLQQQQQQTNNVSLSCPNLNPKQFLIMNKNVISIRKLNEQYGGQIIPIKAIKRPMQILTTNDLKDWLPRQQVNVTHHHHHQQHHHHHQSHQTYKPQGSLSFKSNLAEASKVLNAGSILLTTSQTIKNTRKPVFQEKPIVIKFKTNPTSKSQQVAKEKKSLKGSIISLNDYNDKILDDDTGKEKLLGKKIEEEEEEDDEDEEDDDEEEEDEDDEDEDDEDDDEEEEELCDNWFTQTKAGNYIYKKAWKPLINSTKFIFYSISENLKLFRFFRFSVFALCNFILSFFYEAPFVFINSYMMSNKLSESQAGSVTVAVGIVCIFSSIAYGYIGDSKRINPIILYSASLVLCGLCSCAVPFFITNYLVTMTLMVLMGALISVSDVLVPIICVNIVGYDDFVNAYGLMFFCQGLASLSGPPLLAIIVDYHGDYDLSYYIIGIGIILSGLILSIVLCYNQYAKEKKKELDEAKSNNTNSNKKLNTLEKV